MLEEQRGAVSIGQKPHIEAVQIMDSHAEAVAAFFRAVWDPCATAERIRTARADAWASNPVEPGIEVPAWAVLSDGKILGYIGTIPNSIWNGVVETVGHWMKGFMVLEEYRNGPIGYMVLKESLQRLDLAAVLTVALPARRLFQALGFVDLGVLANYLCVLNPGRVLSRLDLDTLSMDGLPSWAPAAVRILQRASVSRVIGGVAAFGLEVWKTLGRTRTHGLKIALRDGEIEPRELDTLWQRARSGLRASPVRNGAYLRWRYPIGPSEPYDLVTVRCNSELVAVAVVRKPRADGDPRLHGIRVATVSDIVFPADQGHAGLQALTGAENLAREYDADALLCSASHPALCRVLGQSGYAKLPGNVHFLVRDSKGRHSLPTALSDWWLTRGDASSDEVF